MKYVTELRSEARANALVRRIRARVTKPWVIMEVCGGQTHTIMKYGLDQLLPDEVRLVHGPGCPVCVTSLEAIDRALAIASRPDVIFVSYGDMIRVPGSTQDLASVKANGADVRIVYSPAEAVKIAAKNKDKKVVFFAIGFETTAPANAMALRFAKAGGLNNFSLLVSHVLVPPAIRLLLSAPGNTVQGFIGPGHVCTVMGYAEYEELSREFSVPFVVGGFEPVDLLEAIAMLIEQLEDGRCTVENQYTRTVTRQGNIQAQAVVDEIFEVGDQTWRGIGEVPNSGLRIRPELARFDASKIFDVTRLHVLEPEICIAADVLQGRKGPTDCPGFGTSCTPEAPLGAPMVSAEGTCAAYYRFRRPLEGTHV